MNRVLYIFLAVLLFACSDALAQNAANSSPLPVVRDPQALNLVSQSYQAMTGMTALQDATLQAAATWVSGSDEELGTASLTVKGSQESRVILSLTSGQRQEIRNLVSGSRTPTAPPGAWAGPDGVWHPEAPHNCWVDAGWFYPAFALQMALNDPSISVVNAGPDTLGAATAIHLVFYRTVLAPSASTSALIQKLSTLHVYLDLTSGLPIGFRFSTHPYGDAGLDIPVEIRFSSYKQVNSVQVPYHIQKLLQGSLLLDLNVSDVQINSGLSDTEFTIPATTSIDATTATGGTQ